VVINGKHLDIVLKIPFHEAKIQETIREANMHDLFAVQLIQ
jgi:hypothetical protein